MFKMVFFWFVLFSTFSIEATDFSQLLNNFSGDAIKEFALMEQRYSGTHFIYYLIKNNFPIHKVDHPSDMEQAPQKHHWGFIDEFNNHPYFYDQCLFIFIVRDPYTWLQSLYTHEKLAPYQKTTKFNNFISSEGQYLHHKVRRENQIVVQNILKTRSFEIINFLAIGQLVANFIVVNYGKVAKYPLEFFSYLSTYFNLTKNPPFIAIDKSMNGIKLHVKKKNSPIRIQDLEFIKI